MTRQRIIGIVGPQTISHASIKRIEPKILGTSWENVILRVPGHVGIESYFAMEAFSFGATIETIALDTTSVNPSLKAWGSVFVTNSWRRQFARFFGYEANERPLTELWAFPSFRRAHPSAVSSRVFGYVRMAEMREIKVVEMLLPGERPD